MNNEYSQGEGATFGEYATTTNIQSNFGPSLDEISNENVELNGYQTATNEFSEYNIPGRQEINEVETTGAYQSSNVYENQYDSSSNVFQSSNYPIEETNQFSEYQTTTASGGDINYGTAIEYNDYQTKGNEVSFGEYQTTSNYENYNGSYGQSNNIIEGNASEIQNPPFYTGTNYESQNNNYGSEEAQFGEYQITQNVGIEQKYSTSNDYISSSYSNAIITDTPYESSSYEVNKYQASEPVIESNQNYDFYNNNYETSSNIESMPMINIGNLNTYTSNIDTNEIEGNKISEPIMTTNATIDTVQYAISTPSMDSNLEFNSDSYQTSEPILESNPTYNYEGGFTKSTSIESEGYQTSEPFVDSTPSYDYNNDFTSNMDAESGEYHTSKQYAEATSSYEYAGDVTSNIDGGNQTKETIAGALSYEYGGNYTSSMPIESEGYHTTGVFGSTPTFNTTEYQTTEPVIESTPSFDITGYQTTEPVIESTPSFDTTGYQTTEPVIEYTPSFDTTEYQTTESFQETSTFRTDNYKMMEQVDTTSTLDTNEYSTNIQNYETNESPKNYDEYQSSQPYNETFSNLQTYETYQANKSEINYNNDVIVNESTTSNPILESIPNFETTSNLQTFNTEYQTTEANGTFDTDTYTTQNYGFNNISNDTSNINGYTLDNNYQVSDSIGFDTGSYAQNNQIIDGTATANVNFNEYSTSKPIIENSFQNFEAKINTTSTIDTTAFTTSTPSNEISPSYNYTQYNTTYQSNENVPDTTSYQTSTQEYNITPSFDMTAFSTSSQNVDYQDYQTTKPIIETTPIETNFNYESTNNKITPIETSNYETTDYGTTNYETTNYETTDYSTTNNETTDYETTNYETTNYKTTDYANTNYETTDYGTTNYEISNYETSPLETNTNYETNTLKNYTEYSTSSPIIDTTSALQNYDIASTPNVEEMNYTQNYEGNTLFNEYQSSNKIESTIQETSPVSFNFESLPMETNPTTNIGFNFDNFGSTKSDNTFTDYKTTPVSYNIPESITTTELITSVPQTSSKISVRIPEPIIPSNLETGETYGEYKATKKKNIYPSASILTQTSIQSSKVKPITVKIPKIQKVYLPKIKKVYIPGKQKIYLKKPSNLSYSKKYSYVPKFSKSISMVPQPTSSSISIVPQTKYAPSPSISIVPKPIIKDKTYVSSIYKVPQQTLTQKIMPATSLITSSSKYAQNISRVPSIIPSIQYNKSYMNSSLVKPKIYSASTYKPTIIRNNLPFNYMGANNKSIMSYRPRYQNRTYTARKL